MSLFRVGVVQACPVLFDKAASLKKVEAWINKGKAAGCNLLLFPESFVPAYPRGIRYDAVVGSRSEKSRQQWLAYAQESVDISANELAPVQAAAAKAEMFIALGITERARGTLYCSLAYIAPSGELLGVHRKLKPTGLERYIWGEGDGSDLHCFYTKGGKTGGLICWENYMPLARMAMYEQGVDIYLAPTADSRESWQASMQHIALEGRCYVLGCNQVVKKSDYPPAYQEEVSSQAELMCPGGSVIISPMGEILAGPLWGEEGLLTADIAPDLLLKSKLDFDVSGHYARPDVFSFEVKPSSRP